MSAPRETSSATASGSTPTRSAEATKDGGPSQNESGMRGVELFRAGRFQEASTEFTKLLKAHPNAPDRAKKITHYNRARAFYNIGNHQDSLKDAEACIKIDPFWDKGYKCKGLALEGLKRPWEAMEVLLDGAKLAEGVDDDDYKEIIERLNKKTGFFEGDWHLRFLKQKGNKYCVVCDAFDLLTDDFEVVKGEDFLSCKKCQMVNYCSRGHKEENEVEHKKVCSELQKIRGDAGHLNKVRLLPRGMDEEGIYLMGIEFEGALSELADMLTDFQKKVGAAANQSSRLMPSIRGDAQTQFELKCWKEAGKTNIVPMAPNSKMGFPIAKKPAQLRNWEDWFRLPDWLGTSGLGVFKLSDMIDGTIKAMVSNTKSISKEPIGDVTEGTKKVLTGAMTDAMTVSYALREVKLGEVLRIHVVGAEPTKEGVTAKCFMTGLIQLYRTDFPYMGTIKGAMIGPLLTTDPEEKTAMTAFGGTYQEYIGTRGYKRPDLIAAFNPGLYDPTNTWHGVLEHAIAKNIPFLATCNDFEDYCKTKKWLEVESGLRPKVALDGLNPFSSWERVANPTGSNIIHGRNMYCMLLSGKRE